MAVFGLTGSLASGKTEVLGLLKRKKAIIFNADACVHKYYKDKNGSVYKAVAKKFPQCLSKGNICRKKLGKIVFFDRRKLGVLEKIVHPKVAGDLLAWVGQAKRKKGVYIAEVALLFEKRLQKHFDATILVKVKRDILIKRIIKKYKFSKSEARRRLSLYKPVREKIKGADYIIENDKDFINLKKEVDLLWKKIK